MQFLDLELSASNGFIQYKWFQKPTHSRNMLRADTNLPTHMVNNTLYAMFVNVCERHNNAQSLKDSIDKILNMFRRAGHSEEDIVWCIKREWQHMFSWMPKIKALKKFKAPIKVPFHNNKQYRDMCEQVKEHYSSVSFAPIVGNKISTYINSGIYKSKIKNALNACNDTECQYCRHLDDCCKHSC